MTVIHAITLKLPQVSSVRKLYLQGAYLSIGVRKLNRWSSAEHGSFWNIYIYDVMKQAYAASMGKLQILRADIQKGSIIGF